MNPKYIFLEFTFCLKAGVSLKDKFNLCWLAVCSRRPGQWKKTKQKLINVGIWIEGQTYTLLVRNNGSDIRIITTLIKDEEYNAAHLPWDKMKAIVDAGANIGIASLFFRSKSPRAKIITLEPEPNNFRVLQKNLELPNVHNLPAALWNKSGNITLEVSDSAMSHTVAQNPTTGMVDAVSCLSIGSILEKFEIDNIDLLKIDIEGAEKELFSGQTEWLSKVKWIMIECHPHKGFNKKDLVYALRKGRFEVLDQYPSRCVYLIKNLDII